jgi:tetratricopeptide (TPR) repeat protein
MRVCLAFAVLLCCATISRADGVNEHLLAGARAFRAQRYDVALTEFRLVERGGGAADLAIYLGPTLYKLGRLDEARQVLARAHRSGSVDAVAEYYLGLAWYRLGLVRLARSVFVSIDARDAGPKLAEGAAHFVADIDAHAAAAMATTPLLDVADTLERSEPISALDQAEEAFLRARVGSPERLRAAAIIVRIGAGDHDAIARQAASEHGARAP